MSPVLTRYSERSAPVGKSRFGSEASWTVWLCAAGNLVAGLEATISPCGAQPAMPRQPRTRTAAPKKVALRSDTKIPRDPIPERFPIAFVNLRLSNGRFRNGGGGVIADNRLRSNLNEVERLLFPNERDQGAQRLRHPRRPPNRAVSVRRHDMDQAFAQHPE